MTSEDRAKIEAWILNEVSAAVVPSDEGNEEALIYNLIHLLRDGRDFEPYSYKPEQDAELASWGRTVVPDLL
jgi:hypothetical protein